VLQYVAQCNVLWMSLLPTAL